MISPILEPEQIDPKAKKDPKAPAVQTKFTEEEETKYPHRIYYEYRRAEQLEEGAANSDRLKCAEVSFSLQLFYQAPDYEDPNPPEEVVEVKSKKPPAKGAAALEQPSVTSPRMITPDPVPMLLENGRVFRIELGRWEQVLVAGKTLEEVEELKQASEAVPEDWYEPKWVCYFVDQSAKEKHLLVNSNAGACVV